MKSKIIFWILSFINSVLLVTAYHGGKTLAQTRPNPTGISPIAYMIFAALFIGVGYFIYWLLSKEKKEF